MNKYNKLIEKEASSLRKHNFRGINKKTAFNLEIECLQLIEKNYKCNCGLDVYHFPKLKSYDKDQYKFKMTYCGETLDIANNLIEIKNQELQIKCIVENLKRSGVYHLDMVRDGRNITINEEGIISLIDFDIASINKKFLSKNLKCRYDTMTNRYPDDWYLERKLFKSGETDYYKVLIDVINWICYHFKKNKLPPEANYPMLDIPPY